MWLRAGRATRNLTLDDVARVTKIQPRILEKIEAGNLEGLPAEVFVRGFVKSFARCVGLDEGEAVERYGQCANAIGPSSSVARAFVETLVAAPKAAPTMLDAPPALPEILPEASMELAPIVEHPDVVAEPEIIVEEAVAAPAIEVIEVVEAAPIAEVQLDAPKKKRSRKKAAGTTTPRTRKKKAAEITADGFVSVIASEPSIELPPAIVEPTVEAIVAAAEAPAPEIVEPALETSTTIDTTNAADALFAPSDGIVIEQEVAEDLASGSNPIVADPWMPTMPPVAPSVPWKRPASSTVTFKAFTLPSLVIDDADPDLADRERDDRERDAKQGPHRVSFLPPILLDREDKSGRQGGLTLAVILLLIAATLTLSYLMRRPTVSGDGVTQVELVDHSHVA